MITLRNVVIAAAATALSLAFGSAYAQSKHVIKIGWTSADAPQDPYATGARLFKQALERQSNGRIEVQLFPNRQLGDEKPMLEGLRFGTLDAAVITNAVVAQIEPAFQVNDLPFLYSNEGRRTRCSTARWARCWRRSSKPRASSRSASWKGAFAT